MKAKRSNGQPNPQECEENTRSGTGSITKLMGLKVD
jgi:hypothetical protein